MRAVPVDPARFAVVGSPIGHSLSPVLHRAAYRELGLAGAAHYTAHEVGAGELKTFLSGAVGSELSGLSVTMPLKREAFALAHRWDATTQRLGIANTLVRESEGWRAENHDVHGIAAAIGCATAASELRTAAILGSGATACSAAAAIADLGIDDVVLCARSPEKLRPVLDVLAPHASTRLVDWDDLATCARTDLLISALAQSGAEAAAAMLHDRTDSAPRAVLDVLYEPWPAPVAAVLADRGSALASGLDMLVHQAGEQIKSMLGVPSAPLEAMRAAAEAELTRRAA